MITTLSDMHTSPANMQKLTRYVYDVNNPLLICLCNIIADMLTTLADMQAIRADMPTTPVDIHKT
jgi:hypothetical protein